MTCIALWFLICKPKSKVVVTANSANQLHNIFGATLKETYLESALAKFELLEFTKGYAKLNHKLMKDIWFLAMVSVANEEAISGFHSENMLVLVDEADGVNEGIFHRLLGALSTDGSLMFAIGNPSSVGNYFYKVFHVPEYMEKYSRFTWSCIDSPFVDEDFVKDMKEQFGEDSPVYAVRVLGIHASMDEFTAISSIKIDEAFDRELEPEGYEVDFGIDLASGDGKDSTVISIRRDRVEIDRYKFKYKSLPQTQRDIVKLINKYADLYDKVKVKVDVTGLGVQLGQALEEEYLRSRRVMIDCINFSNSPYDKDKYSDIVTEMFFDFKEIVDEVDLIRCNDLITEMCGRRVEYDNRGRFKMESKKAFIKRIGHSPDSSDAVLLAFYEGGDSTARISKRTY